MGRVYEALKRAEQEQKVNFLQPVPYVEGLSTQLFVRPIDGYSALMVPGT